MTTTTMPTMANRPTDRPTDRTPCNFHQCFHLTMNIDERNWTFARMESRILNSRTMGRTVVQIGLCTKGNKNNKINCPVYLALTHTHINSIHVLSNHLSTFSKPQFYGVWWQCPALSISGIVVVVAANSEQNAIPTNWRRRRRRRRRRKSDTKTSS